MQQSGFLEFVTIYMLMAYDKGTQGDLAESQRAKLKKLAGIIKQGKV